MDLSALTHADLVVYARQWLKKKYPIVITEMAGAGEEPDAIGFASYDSVLLECKASRSDFLSDSKKIFRRHPEQGLGNLRYYICPKDMISVDEVPEKWGLIYVIGKRRTRVIKKAQYQEHNVVAEKSLLASLVRRIGGYPIEGISVKCYTYQTKCRTTATIKPS